MQPNTAKVDLSLIKSRLQVRPVTESGLSVIRASMEKVGFLSDHPIVVVDLKDDGYEVIDGNHRLTVAESLGIKEVPILIENLGSYEEKLKRAVTGNNAAESVVPTTFVDHAERIWKWSAEKLTQSQIAEIEGWTREKVRDYANLKRICPEVWKIVGATDLKVAPDSKEGVAPELGAVAPFTERLLRDILPLYPHQQYELVEALSTGEIQKGKFKTRATAYRARNEIVDLLFVRLHGVDEALIWKAWDEVEKGAYDSEWLSQEKPATGKPTTNGKGAKSAKNANTGETPATDPLADACPKLAKLIESIKDEWESKTSIRLIHGDFYEEVKNIPDESVDLILTDPPYNLDQKRTIALEGRTDIEFDFGDWDHEDRESFLEKMRVWAKEFSRILKPGGTGIVFTSSAFVSDLRIILKNTRLKPKQEFYWCKTNPPPKPVHTSFTTSVEMAHLFVKEDEKKPHTFNWPGQEDSLNYLCSPICMGDERIKSAKRETLHPTQKPEAVMTHLMECCSNRGDVVFDGFMGVGTTGAVAKKLSRKFIGIELDETYFKSAEERLS